MRYVRGPIKPFLKVFDDLGIEVVDTTITGSNHYKITVTASGNRKFFIASNSPSDSKSFRNFRAMVRRWYRGMEHTR